MGRMRASLWVRRKLRLLQLLPTSHRQLKRTLLLEGVGIIRGPLQQRRLMSLVLLVGGVGILVPLVRRLALLPLHVLALALPIEVCRSSSIHV